MAFLSCLFFLVVLLLLSSTIRFCRYRDSTFLGFSCHLPHIITVVFIFFMGTVCCSDGEILKLLMEIIDWHYFHQVILSDSTLWRVIFTQPGLPYARRANCGFLSIAYHNPSAFKCHKMKSEYYRKKIP